MTHEVHLDIRGPDTVDITLRTDRELGIIGGDEEVLLGAAHAAGFCLFQRETDTGLLVWEWRRGTEARPQFVTRRVALHWMSEFLSRNPSTAGVTGVQSIADARRSTTRALHS
jgi:hypothetical protein